MVLILNCDKIVFGMFMVVVRVNILVILISGGFMFVGKIGDKVCDFNFVFEGVGVYFVGKIFEEDLYVLEENVCFGCGLCFGMFIVNIMNCLSEVLGFVFFGNGIILVVMVV